jgi:hypothetical protein
MLYRIRNNSGMLSFFTADVYGSNNKLIYTVSEETGSLCRRILRLTKFRTALSLKIIIRDITSGRFYFLTRDAGLFSHSYFFKGQDGRTLFSFEQEKVNWRSFFKFKRSWEIRDGYGRTIARYEPGNPFILGPQEGRVIGVSGEEISHFRWERPSFFRTPRECLVFINRTEEPWEMLSLISAIIKALHFEYR